MDDLTPIKSEFIRRDIIIGSRRFSNYFWAFVVFLLLLDFLLLVFLVIFITILFSFCLLPRFLFSLKV